MLRASAGAELKLMLPMVTEVQELRAVRELLQKEIQRQSKVGEQLPRKLQFGAMLEVPALLWQLDELMSEVDFVSVGSNDLFQFTMAVDRGNSRVADRFGRSGTALPAHAARHARAGERNRTSVTLCGEMASKPLSALALLASVSLGLHVADGGGSGQGHAARHRSLAPVAGAQCALR